MAGIKGSVQAIKNRQPLPVCFVGRLWRIAARR
jgi:hypothetical protein